MKVTFISDTHTREHSVKLPGGDILIFSGDCMSSGYNWWEINDFLDWFSEQPYEYKIWIAGNHDRWIEKKPEDVKECVSTYFDKGVRYVYNETIEIKGLKIYGTPYQPYFCGWAYNVADTDQLYSIFKMIPENLDILITHCPPYDILDKSHFPRPAYGRNGEEPLGSKELSKVLDELGPAAPRYHVFGHIHGDGGKMEVQGLTTYINASVCNEAYDPVNSVTTLEIEPKGDE